MGIWNSLRENGIIMMILIIKVYVSIFTFSGIWILYILIRCIPIMIKNSFKILMLVLEFSDSRSLLLIKNIIIYFLRSTDFIKIAKVTLFIYRCI